MRQIQTAIEKSDDGQRSKIDREIDQKITGLNESLIASQPKTQLHATLA
jgi:hypothetical protein